MTTNPIPSATYDLVPPGEISDRVSRLRETMARIGLDGALILDGINMFYYTGTLQNGVLFIPVDGEPVFFIRRSFERAEKETPLEHLVRFRGFAQLHDHLLDSGCQIGRLGLDETTTPVSIFKKLSNALAGTVFENIGLHLSLIRSVKSDYEVELIREAGKRHGQVYEAIPGFIREGMTEWELGSAIQAFMLDLGYTGLGRLAAFNGEFVGGVISFGESSNYPSASVGPSGPVGLCPAFPFLGGTRRLEKGDTIFVDTGFAHGGYFTDLTRIFAFGHVPQEALEAHQICLEIQEAVRSRLTPGAVPAEIYDEVFQRQVVSRQFEEHFMGFGGNQVAFLGHGIGLVIDEFPPIARKITYPLKKNMAIAVEPKKGLAGTGLVGIENTFLVTRQGGEKLTKGPDEIIVV